MISYYVALGFVRVLSQSATVALKNTSIVFLYLKKIIHMEIKLVLATLLVSWCLWDLPCVESADEEDTLSGPG